MDNEWNLIVNILAVDVRGTNVKILASGESERRKFHSGETMTPEHMVRGVKEPLSQLLQSIHGSDVADIEWWLVFAKLNQYRRKRPWLNGLRIPSLFRSMGC
jgi:hypothetical protein